MERRNKILEVGTPYDKWFPRMCEYGFIEQEDFSTILSESAGGRPATNHLVYQCLKKSWSKK